MDSQVGKKKSKSKPKVVKKDASAKNVSRKYRKGGSKKVTNEVTENSFEGDSEKEVPIAPMKVVEEVVTKTSIPEVVVRKSKKLKMKSKSFYVVITDVTKKEAQESRKKKISWCLENT